MLTSLAKEMMAKEEQARRVATKDTPVLYHSAAGGR